MDIFEWKHRLDESLNHYNVSVQEQLTRAGLREHYRMNSAGVRVSTFEFRQLYTK